ncbi:hypothetical protein FTUN_0773 [Frigoriglobus tundricola]|uniref:RNA polymerase sigma-70 region 2 domain-containing protein n=1 Tax=Frigoriglobus tundricola TaxID=2774151 RepID=A0A6M5YH01_9BACT|nr:hypothetical protein FTUN_0773 [Frigoriglobus tundricola]
MYLTKEALRGLVEECQRERTITPSMFAAFVKIAKYVYTTLNVPYLIDLDDFIQEACMRLMKWLYKIRPEDNVFSYLTELCRLAGCEMRERAFAHERMIDRYILRVKEAMPGRIQREINIESKDKCQIY